MAKDQLPSAKERRRLLAQKTSVLTEVGGRFLKKGRWGEALECLSAVGDAAGMQYLAGQALEAGDLFTWRRALEALGQEPSAQGLGQMKVRAQELGKFTYARATQAMLEPGEESKP
ncbi:HEAT repeat domain-containing protein [Desulfarculales bacterium]